MFALASSLRAPAPFAPRVGSRRVRARAAAGEPIPASEAVKMADTTRVAIRHRLWRDERRVLLERELATLDVPYGESFAVQERWLATAAGDGSCELCILCHVHFRTRLLLHAKIKHHSLKK